MAEEQAVFRPGRGTIEQIFSLRLIVEYLALQDKELYLIFIDFKKVFDWVWQQRLLKVLHHYGIHPKLINLIENLYKKMQSAIRVRNDMTDWFQQTVGVWQGCILSQDFFNIYLEHIMREALDGLESHWAEQLTTYVLQMILVSWHNYLNMLRSFWTELIRSAQSMGKL